MKESWGKFFPVSRSTPAKTLAAKQAMAAINSMSRDHQLVCEAICSGDGLTKPGEVSVRKIATVTRIPDRRVKLLVAEIQDIANRVMIR